MHPWLDPAELGRLPLRDWPWHRGAAPCFLRSRNPKGHSAVYTGALGAPDGTAVPVVLKMTRVGVAEAERERVVAHAVTALAEAGNVPHFARLLCFVRVAPGKAVGLTELPFDLLMRFPPPLYAFLFERIRGAPLYRLPQCPVPGPGLRVFLLSVLAQVVAAYCCMAQAGVAHLDNHLANAILEPVAAPYRYALMDLGGLGTVDVPVVGGRVVLIDWDMAQKAPAPAADAVLRLAEGSSTDPWVEERRPGWATDVRRWNPREDLARLGLMLRDPRWTAWDAWPLLGPALAERVFGPYVGGPAPPPPDHLASDGGDALHFHFLCSGDRLSLATPVALPGVPAPAEALAALLADPELAGVTGGLPPPVLAAATPATLGAVADPPVAVPPGGPPASPWIEELPAARRWLAARGARSSVGSGA